MAMGGAETPYIVLFFGHSIGVNQPLGAMRVDNAGVWRRRSLKIYNTSS